MRVTIDKAGRIVVPKGVRDELALTGGEQLDLEVWNGTITLSPPKRDRLVETEHGLLAMPGGPRLGVEEVRELIERERLDRERRWLPPTPRS